MNFLPPGLRGYYAADHARQSREAQQLGMLAQFLNMQGVSEDRAMKQQMLPLQMEQLRAGVDETRRKAADATERKGFLSQYINTLPETERPAAMLSPETFIKERHAPYTLKPGESRMVGNQPVAAIPESPKLVNLPVPGQPGVEQPTWLRPGETSGASVGGMRMPEILNPAVQLAKERVAKSGATNVTVNPMRETFKDEQALRKEYTDASGSFTKLAEGYAKVKGALASNPTKSAPATLAAATQFMKMLDPESVVRESELQMALQSTGLLDRVMNIHNQIASGKVLTEKQVDEVGKIADVVYEAAQQGQRRRVDHYRTLSRQYNFDPARVVPDLGPTPQRRATDSAPVRRFNPATGRIE
jgi:hypothetical protein